MECRCEPDSPPAERPPRPHHRRCLRRLGRRACRQRHPPGDGSRRSEQRGECRARPPIRRCRRRATPPDDCGSSSSGPVTQTVRRDSRASIGGCPTLGGMGAPWGRVLRSGKRYRALEREIGATPGLFFFCRLIYRDETDFPAWVELGTLRGAALHVERFAADSTD